MAQGSDTGADATLTARSGAADGEDTLAGDAGASRTRVVPRAPTTGDVIGRYVVLDTIGRGGMGVVLAAYDPQLDRKVALKLVRPDRTADRGEIEREARMIAKLRHPNLVTVHDVGQAEAGVFLAMEFIEGVTLLEWQRAERSWREIVEVYVQAARGLAAAHDGGVVHGDFKPQNVFVGALGGAVDVKILDFGLARGAGPEELPTGVPSSWIPAGTLAYMSPARVGGGAPTAVDDQFAFCVAMYEALTGARPYDLETLAASSAEHASPKVVPPWRSRVVAPPWLRAIAQRGIALDADARHESMHEVARALERGPGRARRRTIAFGSLAAIVATAMLVATRPDPCADADAEIRAAWSTAPSATPDDGLDAELIARVETRAAEYVAELSSAARRSCNMTRDGDVLLEARRTRCIDMGLATLRVWADALHGDDLDLRRAVLVDAVGWEAPLTCDDDAVLLSEPEPPPALDRARAREAILRLTRATLTRYAVTFDASGAELDENIEELRELGDLALLAEALYRRGQIATRGAKVDEGYSLLLAALSSAEAAGATRLQVNIWRQIADNRNSVAGGESLQTLAIERAAAGTARLGDPPDLVANLHQVRGVYLSRRGLLDEAGDELQRAIDVAEAAGLARPGIAARLSRVIMRLRSHRIDLALEDGERASKDAERVFGSEHPETGTALGAYSAALSAAGRFDEARATVTRSLAILDGWGRFGVTSANSIACNWCSGVSRACRRDDALVACNDCIDRVLHTGSPTVSSIAGVSLGLNWLRTLHPEAAAEPARRVLVVADETRVWANARSSAAYTLLGVDPHGAVAIAQELCPSAAADTCSESANLIIALHDPDPRRREHALDAAVEQWRASTPSSQADSLEVGFALARLGRITPAELSLALREVGTPCSPDRDAALAWLAANGGAAPTPDAE